MHEACFVCGAAMHDLRGTLTGACLAALPPHVLALAGDAEAREAVALLPPALRAGMLAAARRSGALRRAQGAAPFAPSCSFFCVGHARRGAVQALAYAAASSIAWV